MNRLIGIMAAAASLAVALVAIPANAGAVLDRIMSGKTLKVAVGADWPPMSFLNDKGQLDGYDVDVAKGIAQYLDVQVQFVTPGWDVITAGKWAGRWDLAMGQMTPTKARTEKFDFPAVYIYARAAAAVHKDSKASKLSDLEGKVIGVVANTPLEMYANHNLKLDWMDAPTEVKYQFTPGKVKTYESTNLALDDLRLGDGVRLDAVLTGDSQLRNAIKAGYPIKLLGDSLFSAPQGLATLPGDKEFDDKIAAAIKSMRDDGTLSKLSIKWYGVDNTVAE